MSEHRVFLGKTGDNIRVFATARLGTDTMNDPDRIVETVEHEQIRYGDVPFIAITWEYGTASELHRGAGSGGVGIDPAVIAALPDVQRVKAERVLELSDRWHLNTMHAGCAHVDPVYETDHGRHVPSLKLTPACPVSGYRYGHAWLAEVPPLEVMTELRAIFEEEERDDA